MIVVGLDLSLTSTGVARVNGLFLGTASVDRIRPKSTGHERLQQIVETCLTLTGSADLIVVEGPSYGSASGSQRGHHERAGLWWMVTHALWAADRKVAVASPAAVKTYATGKGNASKDEVLTATVRRFLGVSVSGNDEADALVLAAMGADHLNEPITTMPAGHRKALSKVEWPEAVA